MDDMRFSQYIPNTDSTSAYLRYAPMAMYMRLRETMLLLLTDMASKPIGPDDNSSQLCLVHANYIYLYQFIEYVVSLCLTAADLHVKTNKKRASSFPTGTFYYDCLHSLHYFKDMQRSADSRFPTFLS